MDAELVRRQLARILSSEQFAGAERSSRLLKIAVERVLEDRAATLKEYSLGIEVFGRPESFDPRLDAIVRVEAGRLRTRLNAYYQNGGKSDPVLIELPKGTYLPVFRRPSPAMPERPAIVEPPKSRAIQPWLAALLGAAVTPLVVGAGFCGSPSASARTRCRS